MSTEPVDRDAARWGGIAGIALAVLYVVAILLMTGTPNGDESNAKWRDYFLDSGHRNQIVAGAFVMGVAMVALILFVAALRVQFRVVRGSEWLSTVSLTSGIILAAMLAVAAAAMAAIPADTAFPNAPVPRDADIMRSIESIGFTALLVFGMAAAGLLMISSSVGGGRAALLPRWFVITSVVAGVIVMIGGFVFLPMILFVLWSLASGIFLIRSRNRELVAEGA